MAQEIKATLKRKLRKSSSLSSESENVSPDGKKIFISTLHSTPSEADKSAHEESLDDSRDQILEALTMSDGIGQQLKQILDRHERMEMRMEKMEGVLGHITNLEKAVNSIQANISSFNEKVKKMEETINQIEEGLTSTNADIEAVERKEERTAKKIRNLEDQILYQDVYSRRENLRFFWIPETAQGVENSSEVMYKFFEDELELENARHIEFQRIHRLGKKKAGQSRPIIARFLRFPEREVIFKRVRDLEEDTDVKVLADFPKEIRERRKKLWPKMKKAREEGKVAYFNLTDKNRTNFMLMAYC